MSDNFKLPLRQDKHSICDLFKYYRELLFQNFYFLNDHEKYHASTIGTIASKQGLLDRNICYKISVIVLLQKVNEVVVGFLLHSKVEFKKAHTRIDLLKIFYQVEVLEF